MNFLDQLKKNHVFLGIYTESEEEYYCFFEKKDDNCFYDAISKEKIDINKFTTFNPEFNIKFFKFSKRLYKKNKNIKFKCSEFVDFYFYSDYYNILSFFGIKNSEILFKNHQDKKTLNDLIFKIKKYLERYVEKNVIDVFIKYLSLHDNIINSLIILPKEILNKKIPFWFKDIYNIENGFYIKGKSLKIVDIEFLKDLINEKIIIDDVLTNDQFISDKIKKIEIDCKEEYKQKCLKLLNDRIKESETTLLNEKYYAEEKKDDDLLFEINIITQEINNLKEEIKKLDFINEQPFVWWPELLYPVDSNLNPNNYVNYTLINKLSNIQRLCFDSISKNKQDDIKKYL